MATEGSNLETYRSLKVMNDINEHEFPAGGGWTFRQPQFGPKWENKMAMIGFKKSVEYIISARLANKAITAKHSLATDPAAVANELKTYTRLRLGIPLPAPPSFFLHSSSLSSRVVEAAADIKRAAQGTAVVLDWIQAGGDPVVQDLAEKRATGCVPCPKNVEGAWYTVAPAELLKDAIKGWQALKGSSFAFETSQGEKLKSCDVCKCLMRLKVFCPLNHILAKTKPEIMAEFPPHCWIYKRDQ